MRKLKQAISNHHIQEFVRYIMASAIALCVDYSTYLALATYSKLSLPQAAVCGYIAGLVVAYFLISGKVFKNGWLADKKHFEAVLFLISGLVGVALTYASVKLYVLMISPHVNRAKIIAIIISFVGVYVFRKLFVFRAIKHAR